MYICSKVKIIQHQKNRGVVVNYGLIGGADGIFQKFCFTHPFPACQEDAMKGFHGRGCKTVDLFYLVSPAKKLIIAAGIEYCLIVHSLLSCFCLWPLQDTLPYLPCL